MARSCRIFCIPEREVLFLIASSFGPSSLRIGSICIFCCGLSLSCCDNAWSFAAGSVAWPGAAGAKDRNAYKQTADVKNVKGFLMAALCSAIRNSPIGPKSYKEARTAGFLGRADKVHDGLFGRAVVPRGQRVGGVCTQGYRERREHCECNESCRFHGSCSFRFRLVRFAWGGSSGRPVFRAARIAINPRLSPRSIAPVVSTLPLNLL